MASEPRSPRSPLQPTIGARLTLAFGLLLGLFVVALAVSAQSFGQVEGAEREVESLEATGRAADRAALLMRDQYIHQAHTLIVFDDTHVDHYRDVAAAAAAAVDALAETVSTDEDRATVSLLAAAQRKSDQDFLGETLPAVRSGDRARAVRLHEDMERSVVEFARAVRALHERNAQRAKSARAVMEAALARARAVSLSCLAVAVVVALAIAVFLRGSVVRRLDRLRAAAAHVGSGDLQHRVDLEGSDELADLGRAFDAMTERLARYQTEEVRVQRLASMGQVAAGVAHELNNPLGVILGYVKLLRKRGGVEEESLAVIEQEATLASEIVGSMLDLARPLTLKLARVRLEPLLQECVARLSQQDRFAAVRFSADGESGDGVVRGDESRLRQVLVNVLTNAGEAVASGGRVAVSVDRSAEVVEVRVDDDGPGWPEGERRIPEPFLTTKPQGVGLGLSLARAIVEAHHGSLELGRSPLGGARVTLRLPGEGSEGTP